MMTEKYPTWLTGHVKEWAQKRLSTVTLCSTTGNELLEVWYYGDLLTVKGDPPILYCRWRCGSRTGGSP